MLLLVLKVKEELAEVFLFYFFFC